MPNPADFPLEIFDVILDLALNGSDAQHLCRLSLLSHRWHEALTCRIYSEWTYNGARQPFMTLWKFLLTVRRHPSLASLVRTLNVGNWGFYPCSRWGLDAHLRFPVAELELIQTAIHEAGVSHLEDEIMRSLGKRDRRPLMALLLTSLPNLRTVYAHVPRYDRVLEAVLKQVLDSRGRGDPSQSLRNVRELHLLPEVPVGFTKSRDSDTDPEDSDELDEYFSDEAIEDTEERERIFYPTLHLDYIWPVFYLPNLRSLSLFRFSGGEAVKRICGSTGASHLRDLSIMSSSGSNCKSSDAKILIGQAKYLRHFSFYLGNDMMPRNTGVTITELWSCLQEHAESLEEIDIYLSRLGVPNMAADGHLPLLRNFAHLKHLCIEAEILLGGCRDIAPAPFRLRDTLPLMLESLSLYGEKGFCSISDFPQQLMEVICGEFSALSSIVLQDADGSFARTGDAMTPYQAIQKVCREKGINFQTVKSGQLSIGGKQRASWDHTFYMAEDAHRRNSALFHNLKELQQHSDELLLRSTDGMHGDHDENDDFDSEGGDKSHLRGTLTVFTLPFADHTGKFAYMVFRNLSTIPLPPLFAFSIYFTHTDASPDHTDMTGLYEELATEYRDPGFDVRFDMYFLPGGSNQACIDHYHGEKFARGSYRTQLKMFRASKRQKIHPFPGTSAQLPGMVNRYNEVGPYRSVLYICSDRDWRNGRRTLRYVRFDKDFRSYKLLRSIRGDPLNKDKEREAESLPPITSDDLPLNKNSVTLQPTGLHIRDAADQTMYTIANYASKKYLGPWQEARDRGWTSW